MNCTSVEARLSSYLDGELSGSVSLAVRNHLSQCEACSVELESLRQTKAILHSARVPEPTTSPEELLRKVRIAEREVPRRWAVALIAASAVCAGLVALNVSMHRTVAPASSNEVLSASAADAPYTYSGDTLAGGLPIVRAAYSGD